MASLAQADAAAGEAEAPTHKKRPDGDSSSHMESEEEEEEEEDDSDGSSSDGSSNRETPLHGPGHDDVITEASLGVVPLQAPPPLQQQMMMMMQGPPGQQPPGRGARLPSSAKRAYSESFALGEGAGADDVEGGDGAAARLYGASAPVELPPAEVEAFKRVCRKLNLDAETSEQGIDLWRTARPYLCADDLGKPEPWVCCALYLAAHHGFQGARSASSSHIAFSGITKCCQFTPHEFYLQLVEFAQRANVDELFKLQDAHGRGVKAHAEQRIRQLDVTLLLARRYNAMFCALFPSVAQGRGGLLLAELRPFAWMLFLLCKNRMGKISADPYGAFLLLVAVLRFCYVNAKRVPEFAAFAVDEPANICYYLCQIVCEGKDAEDMAAAANVFLYQTWDSLLVTLTEKAVLNLNANYTGLLAEERDEQRPRLAPIPMGKEPPSWFSLNMRSVTQQYDIMLLIDCLPDERQLIDENANAAMKLQSPVAANSSKLHEYHRRRMLESPGHSSSRQRSARAHITALLRSVASGSGEQRAHTDIPRRLIRHLQSCLQENDVEAVRSLLADRAQRAVDQVLAAGRSSEAVRSSLEPRAAVGLGLYYRILEAVLHREVPHAAPAAKISALFEHNDLNMGLMAIAFETVLFSFQIKPVAFPWILDALAVDPLTFQRSVEIAVRADAGLSTELVKHLAECEIQCLTHLAWQNGTRLAERAAAVAASSAGTASSVDKFQLNTALVLESPLPAPSPALKEEDLFLRKLMGLCDRRLKDLGLRLNAGPGALQLASATLRHCLLHLRTEVVTGVNVDRPLLCSLYIALKVRGTPMTLETIVLKYFKQPHSTTAVIANPSLVDYYNDRFLPAVQGLVTPFATGDLPQPYIPSNGQPRAASPNGEHHANGTAKRILPGSNVTVRFKSGERDEPEQRKSGVAFRRPAHLEVRLFANGSPSRESFERINHAVAMGRFEPSPPRYNDPYRAYPFADSGSAPAHRPPLPSPHQRVSQSTQTAATVNAAVDTSTDPYFQEQAPNNAGETGDPASERRNYGEEAAFSAHLASAPHVDPALVPPPHAGSSPDTHTFPHLRSFPHP